MVSIIFIDRKTISEEVKCFPRLSKDSVQSHPPKLFKELRKMILKCIRKRMRTNTAKIVLMKNKVGRV